MKTELQNIVSIGCTEIYLYEKCDDIGDSVKVVMDVVKEKNLVRIEIMYKTFVYEILHGVPSFLKDFVAIERGFKVLNGCYNDLSKKLEEMGEK